MQLLLFGRRSLRHPLGPSHFSVKHVFLLVVFGILVWLCLVLADTDADVWHSWFQKNARLPPTACSTWVAVLSKSPGHHLIFPLEMHLWILSPFIGSLFLLKTFPHQLYNIINMGNILMLKKKKKIWCYPSWEPNKSYKKFRHWFLSCCQTSSRALAQESHLFIAL